MQSGESWVQAVKGRRSQDGPPRNRGCETSSPTECPARTTFGNERSCGRGASFHLRGPACTTKASGTPWCADNAQPIFRLHAADHATGRDSRPSASSAASGSSNALADAGFPPRGCCPVGDCTVVPLRPAPTPRPTLPRLVTPARLGRRWIQVPKAYATDTSRSIRVVPELQHK